VEKKEEAPVVPAGPMVNYLFRCAVIG